MSEFTIEKQTTYTVVGPDGFAYGNWLDEDRAEDVRKALRLFSDFGHVDARSLGTVGDQLGKPPQDESEDVAEVESISVSHPNYAGGETTMTTSSDGSASIVATTVSGGSITMTNGSFEVGGTPNPTSPAEAG